MYARASEDPTVAWDDPEDEETVEEGVKTREDDKESRIRTESRVVGDGGIR